MRIQGEGSAVAGWEGEYGVPAHVGRMGAGCYNGVQSLVLTWSICRCDRRDRYSAPSCTIHVPNKINRKPLRNSDEEPVICRVMNELAEIINGNGCKIRAEWDQELASDVAQRTDFDEYGGVK